MPHYLIADRSVITERRAAGGWRAVVVGTAVYADGDTEADALAALAALFVEPRKEIADLKAALAPLKALLNGSIKELV